MAMGEKFMWPTTIMSKELVSYFARFSIQDGQKSHTKFEKYKLL